MTAESPDGHRWPAPLGGRLPAGADAAQVADTVVAIWLEIDRALCPIIGHRGVAALYNRALHLTAGAHPCLASCDQGVLAALDTAALKAVLAKQAPAQSAAAAGALFQSFHALLASLVGHTLTERLLRSVSAQSAGPSPAQDTSS